MSKKVCSFCRKYVGNCYGQMPHVVCSNCVIKFHFEYGGSSSDNPQMNQGLKPKDVKAYLDKHIIEQEVAKKTLSVAIYHHYKRLQSLEEYNDNDEVILTKGNILMVGPTGTGKTALADCISDLLDIPYVISDATTLTAAGYVGEDVESVIKSLWIAADRDIERAERGMIVIDEIDKIARKGANMSAGRDVSGESVQQALLKLIEGSEIKIQPDNDRRQRSEVITIDTTNILFILCGAFVGIERLIQQRTQPGAIGFGKKPTTRSKEKDYNEIIKKLHPEDLIKYGFIAEFMGRLPVLVYLESLSPNALRDILWKPKNSQVKQYQKLLELDQVNLTFTDDALDAIVEEALKRKSGARGLRSVIERVMLNVMYDLPDLPEIRHCEIDAAVVRGERKAIIDSRENAS